MTESVEVYQNVTTVEVTNTPSPIVQVTQPAPLTIEVSAAGIQGAVGPTPNLQPGTITTGAPGSSAAVTITGTIFDPLLNLTIPRGDVGPTGPAPTLSAPTVTPLAANATPTASISGSNPYVINFGLPASVQWLSGVGVPASTLGGVGDFYLVTGATGLGDVYKKTGSTTWTYQNNIRGAAGTGDMSKLLSNFTNWTAPAVFRDVFSWGVAGPTNSGSVIITTNIPTDSGSMLRVDIEGEIYTAGTFNGFLEVYMYNNAGGTIYQPKWTNFGALDVPMRLAKNASNNLVIILDAPTGLGNNWSYPRIKVVKVTPTVANSAHYTGWSATVSTDTTTGLSGHVTAAVALDTKYVNSTSSQTIAGIKTFSNQPIFNSGGETLTLKPGASDHAYVGFYARTATPGTRSGYMGYTSAATNNFYIKNEISGGNFYVDTTGNGNIQLNTGTGTVTLIGTTINASGTLQESGTRVYSPNNIPSASVIAAGTLADARLSTNVALLTGAQTFTGAKTFSSTVTSNGTGVTFAGGAGATFTIPEGVGSFTPQIYQSTTTGIAGIGVQVNDGTNNRRAGLFVNHTNGLWGLSHTASTGAVPFVINYANVELMRITTGGFAGFGTTNPAATLQVYSQSAGTRVLTISGRGTTVNVTNKALTANVATLTTATAHGFTVGRAVLIQGVDATFNGTYTIASTPTTTSFTYALTAADVASTAATGTAQSDVQTADLLRIEGGRSNSLITINNLGVPNFGVGIQLTGRTTLDNSIGLSGGSLYFEGAAGSSMYFRPNGAGSNTGMVTISTTGITSSGTGTSAFSGPVTATSFSGSGAGLTGIDGTQITTGTVADARLSSNVVLLTGAQTITGAKTFTTAPIVTLGTNNFKFSGGPSLNTPTFSFGNSTGKSIALLTGSTGGGVTFDDTGTFYITKETKANIDAGTSTGGTPVVTLTAAGNFSTIGSITSGGVLTVPGTSYQTFGTSGLGAPTFTTRSAGTKIVLWDVVGAAAVDYAIGMESGTLWNSVGASNNQFKWYAGTTNVATLTGGGDLTTTGGITASGKLTLANGTGGNAAIEIGRTDGVASTPYIDFHSGATATDVDSRIIASGGNGTTFAGTLTYQAAVHTFDGVVSVDDGSNSFRLLPGTQNHTYMEFYARTATPSVRSGYFGYPGAGSNVLTLRNDISGGDIAISSNGGNVNVTGTLNTSGAITGTSIAARRTPDLITPSCTSNNWWYKVATYTITNIYNDLQHRVYLSSHATPNPYTAEVNIHVRTNDTLQAATNDFFTVSNLNGWVADDIRLIKSQVSNGSTPNIWELWVKAPLYLYVHAYEMGISLSANSSMTWNPGGSWVNGTSAGTSINRRNIERFYAPVGTTAISYGDFANYAEGNTTETTVGRIAGRVHYDLGEGTYIDTRQQYSVHSYYGADLVIGGQSYGDLFRIGPRGIWAEKAIMEKFAYASGTSGTVSIDAAAGGVFSLTPTGNVTTLSINNAPSTGGRAVTLTLVVEGTATAYTIAAPAGSIWFGSQPTRVANKKTMYTFMTADGGTTWLCSGANQA